MSADASAQFARAKGIKEAFFRGDNSRPMVGLDLKSIRLVKDLLRERANNGVTVFMSTHTLAVAEEIGDRIGIIDHGQLKFVGTIDELKQGMRRHDSTLEQLFLDMTSEGLDDDTEEDQTGEPVGVEGF